MVRFTLVIDHGEGKITEIKPWEGKNAEVSDWLRNISALSAKDVRYELATFVETKNDSVVYLDDEQVLSKPIDLAYFSSEVSGTMYDVATHLLSDSIKKAPGTRVRLTLLGCCSIIGVNEVRDDKISCECGCGTVLDARDKYHRRHRFVNGHNIFLPNHKQKMEKLLKRGAEHPRWKGGRKVGAGGYIMVLMRSHPRATKKGYIFEHIVVLEQKIGRYLEPGEQVHHINHNKQDNRPENLQLTTLYEHPKLHPKKRV